MKVQGFILIDVDAAALNNAGTISRAGIENAVETKKIRKEGGIYPYVSGQAWRNWWRTTLQRDSNWALSPVIKEEGQSLAYTNANPFIYPDDDIFGYMRASKEIVVDKDGNPEKDSKGKDKKKDATVTRISPLKNSALISVGNVQIARNFSSMSRQNDVPVPYGKEEYSAIMKGMFSLDIEQVGTFSSYNKTGFKNLSDKLKDEIEPKCVKIIDPFVINKKGERETLLRMELEERKKRILDTIKALKTISGGAMQTDNLVDVTPKFIVLAITKSGNHPFSHIVSSDPINHEQTIFNIQDFKEILNEYKNEFIGDVYIGRRGGFWNCYDENLRTELDNFIFNKNNGTNTNQSVHYYPINETIEQFCNELEQIII
jgi:CRISPR-associated protein Cst2